MFSSWCSPFVLAFLWDALPLFVLLTFCFDLVLAVDKKMEYICIELSVYYGHLFFLVICVSIHNTTSMQTSFESMFMLPQITAHLSHEHPYAPVEMTSYQCQLLCAHINIDDLGFLQASRKKCQTEFKHSGGSEGQFLQFLCLVRSCHDSESVLCSAPPFLFH